MVGPVTPQLPASARPDQVFVGRSPELQLLRVNLAWAGAGQPRVVVVEGPAGIGKSALTRAFLADVGPEVRSLTSSGDAAESGMAFGVVDQLLTGAAQEGQTFEPSTDPLDAGAQLVDVLGALQEAGPALVVVDDAHWADAPSMQALTFALRRLHADRVMVLIARRDGPPELSDGVRRLVDARGQHLRLGGLDAVALAELAVRSGAGRLPVAAAERFRHHTDGSPLHAKALLEQLDPAELRREAGPLPAPRSYAMVVVSRLASCAAATEALVTAAAVLGERCELPAAARVAGLDDPAQALEEAVVANLLEGADVATAGAIAFVHPLIRAAVYHDLGPARRAGLHARAGTVTFGSTALDHRVAATLVDDPDLARQLVDQAATEARGGAWVVAAGHLAAAARLAPDPVDRERFVLEAASAYLRGGETAKATSLLEEVTTDSAPRRSLLGQLALVSGRLDEARHHLEAAWDVDPQLAASVAIQLGHLGLLQARSEEAVRWGRRALEAAGDDAGTRSAALSVVALGLGVAGRGEEALGLLDQGPVAPSEVTAGNADWVFARGVVRYYTEDLRAAGADLAAVSLAGPGGLVRTRINGLACLAKTEYRMGRWDDSVGHADLAVSLAEDADHVWAFAFCRAVATMVLAARGDWARAVAHADAAAASAGASGTAVDLAYAASARAQVAFAQGDPAAVVAAVEPVVELWRPDGFSEPSFLPWREQYADALVSLGRFAEAEEALAQLETLARSRGRRSSLAGATRVRGRIEAARGHGEAAESAFEDALALLDGVPTPFYRALVEEAHGRFLRRQGQRRAAAAHLRSALATFADLGARPFLDSCDRELAACGLSPSPRTHPAAARLTPQELATARLAASGCTNREVAAELVVSVKTVEYHLGHVYAKLGIPSRHRLAAALAGRDLVRQD